MDRTLTYCTNAADRNCPVVPPNLMYGCNTVCCSNTTPYGPAQYYNNEVMCNNITYYGGLTTCCDGTLFNCVCVNTNFACSYVLAQILGCWPSGVELPTSNSPNYLANCVGLGGIQCLVGTCDGCPRLEGEVYRAFYCVSNRYPAVKVELTWSFVSNDYSTIKGSGSTSCSCYGYKRQMVTSWCSSCGSSNGWSDYAGWKTCCYLVYPGHCDFTCAIFSTGSTGTFIHPFNPRHSMGCSGCNNYGFGTGGLGIIRFAVYRHKDGRNVLSTASRDCLACYTCPILKFYPFTQAGYSTINGLDLDTATCTCGYYYYGGCCGKLLGGSCCLLSDHTIPTIDQNIAGTYYKCIGGWAIPMATWRYVCDTAACYCYRHFCIGPYDGLVRSTFRNAPVSSFELPTTSCKAAALCQLWRTGSGNTNWMPTYYAGNNLGYYNCMQFLMPIIMCVDTWTIDPSICGCTTCIRARSGCNYVLNGLCCHSGPNRSNCNTTTCLYKNGSCCGAITSCCQYELAMGQCKRRTVAMCGSSTLPVTDQNGCYILGVDDTIKSITYAGSATCCKPLFWKRSLMFCAGSTAYWWQSNYNA